MNPSPTFRDHGAETIRKHLRKMLSHAEGVHAGDDANAVHKMRVGSRRLRAAVSVFTEAFKGPEFARFEREVKRVTDALGAARDLDVMIDTLTKLDESLPENERSGLESFIEAKKGERAGLQAEVRRALERLDREDIVGRLDAAIGRDGTDDGEPASAPAEPADEATPSTTGEV